MSRDIASITNRGRIHEATRIEVVGKRAVGTRQAAAAGTIRNIAHVVVGRSVAVPDGEGPSGFKRRYGANLPAANGVSQELVGQALAGQFVQ